MTSEGRYPQGAVPAPGAPRVHPAEGGAPQVYPHAPSALQPGSHDRPQPRSMRGSRALPLVVAAGLATGVFAGLLLVGAPRSGESRATAPSTAPGPGGPTSEVAAPARADAGANPTPVRPTNDGPATDEPKP